MMYRFEEKVYARQKALFTKHQTKLAKIPLSHVISDLLICTLTGIPSKYDYLLNDLK